MTDFRAALAGDDDTLREAIRVAGGAVVDAEADPDAVVTLGERALVETALGDPSAPILPVDAGDGRHAVPRADAGAAIAAVADGEGWTELRSTLSVTVGGESRARAVLDATLMTVEPARISEYAVAEAGDPEAIGRVRSDGIVVATPAGSSGYARAAGGSVLAAGTGLSVVPVSPFATTADTWVLDDEARLRVERDDCDVRLIADGEVAGTVPPNVDIRVAVDGRVPFMRVPHAEQSARPRR
ncbi:NAD(+)/NADH kinase [Halobaculum gomorrense]|uniref:NAD+ kinase n=1 Tax=Halobaculum gomorrense TaxID=43928 RepID=A0A1M5K7L8_9EURY|nr:NAD(+)/NADH kinase [Halobaculum gomorrense]SHG48786.1 NAD+ kinase [Halobaculum gomorrense]